MRRGDLKARDKLVEANLRFVILIARGYQNLGTPLDDVISAGNVGLIHAAERFDETKGFRFISYAVWWIRHEIREIISDYPRLVRLPSNRIDLLYRIDRYAKSCQSERNVQPAEEEIARELGISEDDLVDTIVKGQKVLSLDALLDEATSKSLMDITADENQESPEEQLIRDSLDGEIRTGLQTLKEQTIAN